MFNTRKWLGTIGLHTGINVDALAKVDQTIGFVQRVMMLPTATLG